jgi:hypothetical protein
MWQAGISVLTRSAQRIVGCAALSLLRRQENSPTPNWRIDERLRKLHYLDGEANERIAGNPAMPTSSISPGAANERDGSQYNDLQNTQTPESVKDNRRRKNVKLRLWQLGLRVDRKQAFCRSSGYLFMG